MLRPIYMGDLSRKDAALLAKCAEKATSVHGDSNITIIEKRTPLPYWNWNVDERKEPWEYTAWDRPSNWLERLKKKFGRQAGGTP